MVTIRHGFHRPSEGGPQVDGLPPAKPHLSADVLSQGVDANAIRGVRVGVLFIGLCKKIVKKIQI